MNRYKMGTVTLIVAIGCIIPSVRADDFEMKGIVQYDVSDSAIPDWLKLVGNWGLFRFSLYKVWERRKGVDADVTIRNVEDGKTYTYNLKRKKRFNLPEGGYRLSCDKYDVSVVECKGELNYSINRENVFYSYVNGNSVYTGYRGCRRLEVLFYPKGSSVTVKGRIVDENKHPIVGVEVCGSPKLQSEADSYYYCSKKSDGSSTDEAITNANGEFVFENEPPTAVELGVFYLLTGKSTKPMQRAGEVALEFCISVRGYKFPSPSGYYIGHYYVPLLSASNLPALRKVADKLWSYMPEDGKATLNKMKVDAIALPVSTNNVIYVGDLVVRKDEAQK